MGHLIDSHPAKERVAFVIDHFGEISQYLTQDIRTIEDRSEALEVEISLIGKVICAP
jgi:hypothetical protein